MKTIIEKTNERINALKEQKKNTLAKLNALVEQNKEKVRTESIAMENAIAAEDAAAYSKAKAAKIAAEDAIEMYKAKIAALTDKPLVDSDGDSVISDIQEYMLKENEAMFKRVEKLLAELDEISKKSDELSRKCAQTMNAWNKDVLCNIAPGSMITPKRMGYRISLGQGVKCLMDIYL